MSAKTYWDSSALVEAYLDVNILTRLRKERGSTRPHSLVELFSTLTGGRLGRRLDADEAAQVVKQQAEFLDFVEISSAEILEALKEARKRGVRGGRVHDYIHAIAAAKAGAKTILTLDANDFNGLSDLKIEVL